MDYIKFIKSETAVYSVCIIISVLNATILCGWLFEIEFLVRGYARGATVPFITSLLFILWSFLITLRAFRPVPAKYLIGFSGLVVLFSSLTLVQYVTGQSFGLDALSPPDAFTDTPYPRVPGRMSVAECVIFMVFGLYHLTASFCPSRFRPSLDLLLSALLTFITTGLFFNIVQLFTDTAFGPGKTSVFTFLSGLFLVRLTFFLYPPVGITAIAEHDTSGGKTVRGLLPFIFLVVTCIAVCGILINRNGWANPQQTFMIMLGIVWPVAVFVAYFTGWRFNRDEQVKEKLRASLEERNRMLSYYQQALEAGAGISRTDGTFRYTYVNDKFARMLGYTAAELTGQELLSLTSDKRREIFARKIKKILNEDKLWQGEVSILHRDGKKRWFNLSAAAFKDENGDIEQLLNIYFDITDRKKRETQTATEYREIAARSTEMEQFAYMASHDLQEPLRTITNYSEVMLEDYEGKLDGSADRILHYINDAAVRMTELIKGLLDYSRIGKTKDIASVSLDAVVKDVLTDLAAKIADTRAEVTVQPLPTVTGYPVELRLLFQNLTLNALKFRREGVPPVIDISVTEEEDKWRFEVKDNGIGIKEDALEKIFVMFQRLHSQKGEGGTGIGLAHCQKIVQLHGGRIWAESVPKEGTSFFFTLQK